MCKQLTVASSTGVIISTVICIDFIGGVYPAYEPVNHFNYSLCSDPSPNHYDIPVPVLISLTVVVIIGAPLLLTLIAK